MNKFKVSLHLWVTLFLLFLLKSPLLAQDAATDFTNLNLQFPDLPTSAVHDIYEDDRGIMWFCTNEGLYSFDGLAVKHFKHKSLDSNSLSGDFVYCILQDNAGLFWIGTKNGLTTYDPWQPVGKEFRRLENKPGYPRLRVYDMVKDNQGRIWGSTRGESGFCINPVTGSIKEIPDISAKLCFDSKKNVLYCGKDFDGFATIDPESAVFTSWKPRLDSIFLQQLGTIEDIMVFLLPFVDSKGFIWSGYKGNFVRYNPGNGKMDIFKSHAAGDQIVRVTAETPDGSIWFGTTWSGLYRFDPSTNQIISFPIDKNDPSRIPTQYITSLFSDSYGTLWIGTASGIFMYNQQVQSFRLENPLKNIPGAYPEVEFISFLELKDGSRFYGTTGQTILQNPDSSIPRILHGNKATNQIVEGNTPGDYWIGSYEFLYAYKKNRFEIPVFVCDSITRTKYPNADVTKIVKDTLEDDPVFWIGTNCADTYLYNLTSGALQHFKVDPADPAAFPKNCTYDIEKDQRGRIWFATYGGGLARLEDRKQLKFTSWNRNNSTISSDIVLDLEFDRQGNCWLVTELGVDIFDGKTFRSAIPYLPVNTGHIINITSDIKGNMWFATNRDLIRLNLKDYTTAIFTYHRNFREILQWNTTLLSKKLNGTIAIPAYGGIVFFDPEKAFQQKTPSKTLITGLDINDKPFNNLLRLPAISLSYSQNFLTFNFACLNYINSSLNRFSWKLEGADKDWITPADNRNFASYSTLPPGDYVFRVKSCNADGVWDEKGAFIKFKIHPPWWATWWFISFVLMTIAGAIYWLFNMRTARISERQQADFDKKLALESERNRIARDIHDDISSGLSAINLLANYIQQNPRNSDMHKEILRITESSRDINQRLREIIWSVSSEADNLESLISFLRRYLMDFGELHQLATTFSDPETIPKILLTGEVRQNLFLCFKEVLNNVAKYAQATKLEVTITLDEKQVLLIEIKDNGIGFEWENALKKGGNGLKNIQVRMAKAGGEARFLQENGTTVILSCPV